MRQRSREDEEMWAAKMDRLAAEEEAAEVSYGKEAAGRGREGWDGTVEGGSDLTSHELICFSPSSSLLDTESSHRSFLCLVEHPTRTSSSFELARGL